jgi:hypothetical protein
MKISLPSAESGAPANATAPTLDDEPSRRRILAIYKQMLVSLFVATLVVIVVLAALILPFFISYYVKGNVAAHDPPLLSVVELSGALGAFFSSLMRLYNFQDLPRALVARELEGLPRFHLLVYSLVPAVVGAIAATVIHMLFASGMLQGDLFPKFGCKNSSGTCGTFGSLIADWGPVNATDYAKVIVWGFIAGFAERLVPDTLQGLSKSAEKTDRSGHNS